MSLHHRPPSPPVIPGYEFLRHIGGGGMADVYLAHDKIRRRAVAVKVLREGLSEPDLRRRFEQEGQLLARFSHPNIIPVYEAGQTNGMMYFVLKYLPEGTLSQRMAEIRTSARRVVEIVAKIVSAVVYSHSQGVIHRDLKPVNVLMERSEPVVSDFGIAKWLSASEKTVMGTRIGTPAYMCPEMLENGSSATGPQADVWSAGVILYQLLAGRLPFLGNTDSAVLDFIRMGFPLESPTMPDILPGNDARLLTILRQSLAVDPRDRYPTAAGFEADLQRWLAGQEIVALEPTPLPSISTLPEQSSDPTPSPPPAPSKRRWWLFG